MVYAFKEYESLEQHVSTIGVYFGNYVGEIGYGLKYSEIMRIIILWIIILWIFVYFVPTHVNRGGSRGGGGRGARPPPPFKKI